MKILIDLTSLADNFSGIERYALNISKQIIFNDKNNEYILIFKNSIHEKFKIFEKYNNIEIRIINGKNKLIFNQVILPYHLYSMKADRYLFLAFPSPILFRKKGIINTVHDLTCYDYPETMKVFPRLYFKFGIRNAVKVSSEILTVSKFSKKRIEDTFGINNVNIIYNGVSEVFLASDSKNTDENTLWARNKYGLPHKYLMCLCTLEPRKNIELLINAYVELRNENKLTLKLVLVGRKGWKIEKLLDDINTKYVNDIIVTGFVDDEDLPLIYKAASCFIFPSLYEGFGIPVIEAMYMNVPVICSNTSSLPEVVNDCGILFENNNKEDLKYKILEFLNKTENEISNITKLAKKRSKEFSWCNEAVKLIKLL
ncbi:glycosyltransferase family 4 protein [Clostridium beijerinckii]|uniref:Glycosyltransferase family 4 protein n=1 Tax=Clostridium beijerinckii TaxID=1520 RepID=A0A7X9SMT8_CLOBE|nr:glycosyltransferase family 1 protein [Clostridium beijerinckii]NMF04830.1 glycosyltransferase family 4 protein [Clostridium beijerinckii]